MRPGSTAAYRLLLACEKLINSLVNPTDDTLAESDLCIQLPARGSTEAGLFFGDLRYARVIVDGQEKTIGGGGTRPHDLSKFDGVKGLTPIIAKIPLKAGVTIEFFKDSDRTMKTTSFSMNDWTLPRLIQKGDAEPADGKGIEWKLKLRVPVNGADQTLEAFSIRLDPTRPLPQKKDWPQ